MSRIVFSVSDSKSVVVRLTTEPLLVGRRPESAIQIDEPSVSGRHAELQLSAESGACRCRDLGSTNGTRINGKLIEEGKEATLRDGDRVEFGAVAATFQADKADDDEDSMHETVFTRPASGSAVSARLVVGATLDGRYRLEESLSGAGGYTVFRAHDLSRDEPVSLRVLAPELVQDRAGFARLGETVARLQAAPHSNLTRLHDLRPWVDRALLAAEWHRAVPLLDVLRRRQRLTLPETLSLLRPAADAADHAHRHGLLPLDFDLRPTLLAFDGGEPSANAAPEPAALLNVPLEGWPPFRIMFSPRVSAGAIAGGDDAPSSLAAVTDLAALGYELLGYPMPGIYFSADGAVRRKPKVVANLGEAGNRVLARGLTGAEPAFASYGEFVETLAGCV